MLARKMLRDIRRSTNQSRQDMLNLPKPKQTFQMPETSPVNPPEFPVLTTVSGETVLLQEKIDRAIHGGGPEISNRSAEEIEKEMILKSPGQIELDWAKAELHLANVEANLLKYAGQAEHNPYLMMREMNLKQVKIGLNKGPRTQLLYDTIMGLDANVVPHVSNLKSLPDMTDWE